MAVMRVKLARSEAARGMTHRDYVRALHEAVHAANLPVERAGESRPVYRIVTGPPLGTGHTSRCEYVDLELSAPIACAEFRRRLQPVLPEGVEVLWLRRMPAAAPHLMASIETLRYDVKGQFDAGRAECFHQAAAWPMTRTRTKKEQHFDLKRSVSKLAVHPDGLTFTIVVRGEGTPKAEDVISSVFGIPREEAQLLPAERSAVTLAAAARPGLPDGGRAATLES